MTKLRIVVIVERGVVVRVLCNTKDAKADVVDLDILDDELAAADAQERATAYEAEVEAGALFEVT
jgi:hypothetical protein